MSFIVFAALVAAAALTGAQFEPGEWYAQLSKPGWTPPNWVFAPVWSVLYVAIAVAGWSVWRVTHSAVPAIWAWAAQLLLNTTWSWLFFGLHRPALAFIDIVLLLAAIATFIVTARKHSALAAWLFAPYLLWVGYAATLNFAIVRLN